MAPRGLGSAATTPAALVVTLADVPLRLRVRGALEVVTSDAGLSIPGRYAVVAAAIWPEPVATPDTVLADLPYPQRWPAEVRLAAVAAYQAGAPAKAVSERFGMPVPTVRDWVRRSRS